MLRILVVEDRTAYYQDYLLRIFAKTLPMDEIHFTHVTNIAGGLEMLVEDWDVILMDYALGAAHKVEETGSVFRNGSDLVRLRRQLEHNSGALSEDGPTLPASFIIGISSNQVGNRAMVETGADTSLLKIYVHEIAKEIKGRLNPSE